MKAELAIFMGQSNMCGRGEWEKAVPCPEGHGYEFRAVTSPDRLFAVRGPFGKNENNEAVNDFNDLGVNRRRGDMVSALMESYYSKNKIPIVGVQCSRGGTDVNYWTDETRRREAVRRLTLAKEYLERNGYETEHIFMVWCQGETDGDRIFRGEQSIEGYKSGTRKVFSYMRETGVTDMFIIRTGHFNADDPDGSHEAAYMAVSNAQAELAAENERIHTVASFLGCRKYMKDAFHYHQEAYNKIGAAAGAKIASLYTITADR